MCLRGTFRRGRLTVPLRTLPAADGAGSLCPEGDDAGRRPNGQRSLIPGERTCQVGFPRLNLAVGTETSRNDQAAELVSDDISRMMILPSDPVRNLHLTNEFAAPAPIWPVNYRLGLPHRRTDYVAQILTMRDGHDISTYRGWRGSELLQQLDTLRIWWHCRSALDRRINRVQQDIGRLGAAESEPGRLEGATIPAGEHLTDWNLEHLKRRT